MKLLRLGPIGAEVPVVVQDGRYFDLRGLTSDIDGAFLVRGGLEVVREALAGNALGELVGADELRVGAPIARPGKIVCIGLNYRDHAAETGAKIPAEPIVFMKDPMTVVGPNDSILVPRTSTKTDWEVELGVVIGTKLRYADSEDEALAAVAGYAIANDVSERAFQIERGGQWDKGKSCETFCPLGPTLVTADEVDDPQALGLRLWVNGDLRQNGTTSDMIFGVAEVLHYLSQFLVLYPGDLVLTGTPAGVAMGQSDQPFLRAGDSLALEIDGLGRAEQPVVAA